MATIKFTKEHEWVRVDGDIVVVGITDFAQEQLGDIVYVEAPEVGTEIENGADSGVVESVKAASELYAPLSGEVTAINDILEDEPAKLNTDPMGDGWIFKMKLSDPSDLETLMDEAAYKDYIATLD